MHVGVIALPGTFDSQFTAVVDVLNVADALRPQVDPYIPAITVTVLGVRPVVRTRNNLIVEAERDITEPTDDLDVLVVPALGALTEAGVDTALSQPEARELETALRHGALGLVPTVAGACTGTFLLAQAGCLDGARAATCWWLGDAFRRRYPQVELETTRMVVRDGRALTAGAAFAHIDLAISLVADVSARLADVVARHLLVDDRPAHSAQAAYGHLAGADPLVTAFEDEVRRRLDEPLRIPELADALGVTRRTLERHVAERTGTTPAALIERLRLERARHLQRTTELSVEHVARRVGYASGSSLRRALTRSDRA